MLTFIEILFSYFVSLFCFLYSSSLSFCFLYVSNVLSRVSRSLLVLFLFSFFIFVFLSDFFFFYSFLWRFSVSLFVLLTFFFCFTVSFMLTTFVPSFIPSQPFRSRPFLFSVWFGTVFSPSRLVRLF